METGVCCIEKMLIRSRRYLITALHFPIKQQMNRWQHVWMSRKRWRPARSTRFRSMHRTARTIHSKNYLRNISDIQISALQSNGMFRWLEKACPQSNFSLNISRKASTGFPYVRRCEKLHISKTCRCVWTDCCSRLLKKSQSWNRFNCLRTGDGSRKILAGVKVSETEMNDKAACVRCEEAIE